MSRFIRRSFSFLNPQESEATSGHLPPVHWAGQWVSFTRVRWAGHPAHSGWAGQWVPPVRWVDQRVSFSSCALAGWLAR